MPARSRSLERAPSAATSRLASMTLPSASVTSMPSGRDSQDVTAVGPKIDVFRLGARDQRIDQIAVFDHMRERLARLDIAGKGQEYRPGRVLQPRIGHDHVEDRLRLVRDRLPDPEGFEQPPAGRDDGGRPRIAARPRRQRRIGHDDREYRRQVPGAAPAPAPDPANAPPQMTMLRCADMLEPALLDTLATPSIAGRNRFTKQGPSRHSGAARRD